MSNNKPTYDCAADMAKQRADSEAKDARMEAERRRDDEERRKNEAMARNFKDQHKGYDYY